MKKQLLSSIAVLVLSLVLTINITAQTAANATWALTADTTATVTGNIVAVDLVRAGGLAIKDYAGATMLTPALRFNLGTTSWPTETAPVFTRYAEFKVSPKPGFSFNVDSVSYIMACTGTTGHIFGNVYWDIDPSFNTKVIVDTSTVAVPDVRSQPAIVKTYSVNFVINNGQSFILRFFPWYDSSPSTSKYFVLQNIVIKGTTSPGTSVEGETEIPTNFELEQNYPNPFNPTTNINFSLNQDGMAKLVVFNSIGQEVATLLNGYMQAGRHNINFDASNLPTGVYVYSLITSTQSLTKKMMLVK